MAAEPKTTNTDSHPDPARLSAFIDGEAKRLGFSAWGAARPDELENTASRLDQYVELGRHGTMDWMTERMAERSNPRQLWQETGSIIMLAMNYGPESDPMELLEHPDKAIISVYARNRDYHDIIKGRLKEFAGRLVARFGGDVKVFVDTAPVMEKPLAALSGIGWQGKHTNLVSRQHGSWLFLGAIFTTLTLPAYQAEDDHCGSCRACLDICPTNAFPEPYQLDARRCISYLTIEHKGPIPHEFRPLMGNRIYGCDDCLAVCPWNKFAAQTSEAKLQARHDLLAPPIVDFLAFDDGGFRSFFTGSPVKRIGRDRFVRNVLIAAGNSNDLSLVPHCERLLADASPLVRGAAVWALSRLLDHENLRTLITRTEKDSDPDVQAEWTVVQENLEKIG